MATEPRPDGDVQGPRKSAAAFRTISEVATELNIPAHVLRFWESKFSQVKPLKRGGGRRYYRPEDIALLRGIRELLYVEGYTIKGVQKLMREGGIKTIAIGNRSTLRTCAHSVSVPYAKQKNTDRSQYGEKLEMSDANRAELAVVLKELELLQNRLKKTLA